MSLLEEAKKLQPKIAAKDSKGDEETMNLCLAFLKGEIEEWRVKKILNYKSIIYIVFKNLRQAYRQGKLIVRN